MEYRGGQEGGVGSQRGGVKGSRLWFHFTKGEEMRGEEREAGEGRYEPGGEGRKRARRGDEGEMGGVEWGKFQFTKRGEMRGERGEKGEGRDERMERGEGRMGNGRGRTAVPFHSDREKRGDGEKRER